MNLDKFLKQADKLPGGLGDDFDLSTLPKKELELGMDVESEHTPDPELQKEIVADHEVETVELTGEPNYYEEYLVKMEDSMKKESFVNIKNIDTLLKVAEEASQELTPEQAEQALQNLDVAEERIDSLYQSHQPLNGQTITEDAYNRVKSRIQQSREQLRSSKEMGTFESAASFIGGAAKWLITGIFMLDDFTGIGIVDDFLGYLIGEGVQTGLEFVGRKIDNM